MRILCPHGKLGAGHLQNPVANDHNHAIALCHGNKVAGHHKATARVIPAQQGFCSYNLSLGSYLWLMVQREL